LLPAPLRLRWFVMSRFPADFVGSDLCWRGEVLWEGADEHFEAISHPTMTCRTLMGDDVNRKIFGVAISSDLVMRLAPSATIRARQLVWPILPLIRSIPLTTLPLTSPLR